MYSKKEIILTMVEVNKPIVEGLLTPRKRQILELASRGLSNGEIASDLGIKPDSVKNHLHAAADALVDVGLLDESERSLCSPLRSTTAIACIEAAEHGLIPPISAEDRIRLDLLRQYATR